MADLGNFDANEVKPSDNFEPVPAGTYEAVIIDSVVRATKAGTGEYLQLTFQIIEGEYRDRLVWTRLNMKNPSKLTVQMAKGELSAICRAVGVMKPNDSSELHDLPVVIDVRCKKRSDTGEINNEIKGYSKRPIDQPNSDSPDDDSVPPWSHDE